MVTWPSPASTTRPLRRTQSTVVERIRRLVFIAAILDYISGKLHAIHRRVRRERRGDIGTKANGNCHSLRKLRRRLVTGRIFLGALGVLGGRNYRDRSFRRYTNFNPDQVSSIAQTFTSTMPAARPILRTMSSVRSVGTPE